MEATILTVVNKFGEVVVGEYQHLHAVDGDVRDLGRKLEVWMTWVQMAEQANHTRRSKMVGVWMNQLRRAMLDAEDIVDEYFIAVYKSRPGFETRERRRWPCNIRCLPEVPCFPFSVMPCFPLSEVPLRYTLSQDITNIIEVLKGIQDDSLVDMRTKVEDLVASTKEALDIPSLDTLTNKNFRCVEKLIGSDEHIKCISRALLGGQSDVVVVTGESGVGKSTAARAAIQDGAVQKHFDVRAWVCLPAQSRVGRYLDKIREQAQEQTHGCDWPTSEEGVKQVLARLKLLVVLDGMDSEAELMEVLGSLPHGAEGSRTVVTTENPCDLIIEARDDITMVEIKGLRRDECLKLLDSRLYPCSRDVYMKHHDKFSDKIFAISGGLPLAVVLISGLLYFKDKEKQWDEVFDLLETCEHKRQIKGILTVSYGTMPTVLRLCMLYFAAMPANVPLDINILLRLWSAEALFVSEQRDLEEAQREGRPPQCILALVSRGLLQLAQSPDKVCIHQRVQSFAKDLAHDDGFMEADDKFRAFGASTVRGLSIQNYSESETEVHMGDIRFNKLRILLGYFSENPAPGLNKNGRFKSLRHSHFLRVIELQCVRLGALPDRIGDMIHLRYLGVRGCSLTHLPDSVAMLLNLETLDITDNDIGAVVDKFWMIQNLKHVLANKLSLPTSAACMASDSNLETLHGVVLSPLSTQEDCPLDATHKLFSLEVVLATAASVPVLANALKKISSVKRIKVKGDIVPLDFPSIKVQSLELDGTIQSVTPNYKLTATSLVLRSSRLSQSLLHSLVSESAILELELLDKSFTETQLVLKANGSTHLRKLKLGNLELLEELVIQQAAMPRLETLEIFGCPNMKIITGLKDSICLKNVALYDMPEVVATIKAEDPVLFDKVKHVMSAAWANTT
ncbi:unnamed protein product [Triticum turgidum subsp. durum]|uniref:Uncharacterized protein n=1 Tax=Triticum turgidum subsp. durum TaxID=4567 RepID=A0A9R0QJ23_TRITD|nr:unnamed protein product [Triticum turgidum subsp. durum]